MCVCVCVCVCNIPLYIFVFVVYLLVSYMCAKIRVWSCLVTDNFGLFTEILPYVNSCVVGGRMARNLFILSIYVFIHFSAVFLYGALCPRSC